MAIADTAYFATRPAADTRIDWRVWAAWIAGFALFSAVLPRDVSYDVAHYQIHNGWAALNDRLSRDFAPADMHSFINPAYNILVWWLIERLPGPAVSAALSIPQALILPALFYLTRGLSVATTGSSSRMACLVIAGAGFLADAQFALFASVRNDAWGAAAFIGALALSFRADGSLAGWRRLVAASLIMGVTLGMKATNLPYTIAFAAFVIILSDGFRQRIETMLICGAVGFLAAMALALPYAWVLWSEFSNPVFPMANSLFDSPLGPDDYDAYSRRKPETLIGLMLFPFVFTFDSEIIGSTDIDDIRLLLGYVSAVVLVAMLAWARWRKSSQPGARLLLATAAAFLIGLFAWMQAFSVLRYFLAGWILGPVLAYLLLLRITGKHDLTPQLRRFGLGGIALMVVMTGPMELRRAAWEHPAASYVSASIPQPERFDDAFILFTGGDPSAFLATQFPESATFGHAVMQDYFSPALENYQPLMREALWTSNRPVYAVLFEPAGLSRAPALDRLAGREGLEGQPDACDVIETNFEAGDGQWLVCPLERGTRPARRTPNAGQANAERVR